MSKEDWVEEHRASWPTLNFREALSEILWNWQPQSSMAHHQIQRDEDGIHVDKLYLGPTTAQYKTSNWNVAPGVYEKLNLVLDVILPLLEPHETDENPEPFQESPEEYEQRMLKLQEDTIKTISKMKDAPDQQARVRILSSFLSGKEPS